MTNLWIVTFGGGEWIDFEWEKWNKKKTGGEDIAAESIKHHEHRRWPASSQ
jgi:hypothetical protein